MALVEEVLKEIEEWEKKQQRAAMPSRAVVALAEQKAAKRQAELTEVARSPLSPRDELRLDAIEQKYRELVQIGRTFGLDFAADNLQRFLDGVGGTNKVTREEALNRAAGYRYELSWPSSIVHFENLNSDTTVKSAWRPFHQ